MQAPLNGSVSHYQHQAVQQDRAPTMANGGSHHHQTSHGSSEDLQPLSHQQGWQHEQASTNPAVPSYPPANQARGSPWNDTIDDGADFFDDTPTKATPPQQQTGPAFPNSAGHSHHWAGNEAVGGQRADNAEASEPGNAWRAEHASGSPSVSPFTAMSSQEPADWDHTHQVRP